MLVTSSDSFRWGEGPLHQLGKDRVQEMGPQNQWDGKIWGGPKPPSLIPRDTQLPEISSKSQASQGINQHTALAKQSSLDPLSVAPRLCI